MIITAYHGTTSRAANIATGADFRSDVNSRPKWLGAGVYFFQDAPRHAREWAEFLAVKRHEEPLVFKATIDLTESIDLLDTRYWPYFQDYLKVAKQPLQRQIGPNAITSTGPRPDFLGYNYEDDFHIQKFISLVEGGRKVSSIRCAFIEGAQLYANSWFFDQSHVAVCVRRTEVITSLIQEVI